MIDPWTVFWAVVILTTLYIFRGFFTLVLIAICGVLFVAACACGAALVYVGCWVLDKVGDFRRRWKYWKKYKR